MNPSANGTLDQGQVQSVFGQPTNCYNCHVLRQNVAMLEHSLRTKSYLLQQSEDQKLLLTTQYRQLRAIVESVGMMVPTNLAEVPRPNSLTGSESVNTSSAPITSTYGGGIASGIFGSGRPGSAEQESRNGSIHGSSTTTSSSDESASDIGPNFSVDLVSSDLEELPEIEIIEVVTLSANEGAARTSEDNEPGNMKTDEATNQSDICVEERDVSSPGRQQEKPTSVTLQGISIVCQLDLDRCGQQTVEDAERTMNADSGTAEEELSKTKPGASGRKCAGATSCEGDPSIKRRRLTADMSEKELKTLYGKPIISLLPASKDREDREGAQVTSRRRLRSNSQDKAPVASRAKLIAAGIRQYLEELKEQALIRNVRPGERKNSLCNKFCIAYGNTYRWAGNAIEGKRSDKYVLVYVIEEVHVRDGITLYCCDKYIRDDPDKDQDGLMWFTKENKVSQPFFETDIVHPIANNPIIRSKNSPFVCYRVADLGDAATKL